MIDPTPAWVTTMRERSTLDASSAKGRKPRRGAAPVLARAEDAVLDDELFSRGGRRDRASAG